MAISAIAPNTSTLAASAWKKWQAPVEKAIRWSVDECRWVKDMKDAKFVPTLREVLFPMMLTQSGGAGSVPEDSYKMIPRTANPQDGTAVLVHFATRMAVSYKGIEIQNRDSRTALLTMLKLGAMSSAETLSAQVGDYFYAPGTAVLAQTDTDMAVSATDTLTLNSGLDQSWITNAAYIAARFRVNDKVRGYLAAAQVTNMVGTVIEVLPATPAIVVVWDGTAPGISTDNIQLVKANSMNNANDDYNRGLAANYIDIPNASSLHSLATSAAPNWAAAGVDTAGGRLTYTRILAALHAVENQAPDPAQTIFLDQGVLRDIRQNYEGQMRFQGGSKLEIDGDLDVGLTIKTSRRVPPGTAMVCDLDKWQMFYGKPPLNVGEDNSDGGVSSFSDLYESENQYMYLADLNWIGNLICRSRRSFYFFRGLTTQ